MALGQLDMSDFSEYDDRNQEQFRNSEEYWAIEKRRTLDFFLLSNEAKAQSIEIISGGVFILNSMLFTAQFLVRDPFFYLALLFFLFAGFAASAFSLSSAAKAAHLARDIRNIKSNKALYNSVFIFDLDTRHARQKYTAYFSIILYTVFASISGLLLSGFRSNFLSGGGF